MLKGVFGLKETVLDMLSILSGEKKKRCCRDETREKRGDVLMFLDKFYTGAIY